MINKHIKEEIKEEKTARISKLARTFGLADIYVFGSGKRDSINDKERKDS